MFRVLIVWLPGSCPWVSGDGPVSAGVWKARISCVDYPSLFHFCSCHAGRTKRAATIDWARRVQIHLPNDENSSG